VEAVDDSVSTSSFNQDCSSLGGLDVPVVVDRLHILKRFRSRIRNCAVRNGFTAEAPIANVSGYWQELDLASAVFSTRSFSKMHDDLVLQLFSLWNCFASHEQGDRAMLADCLVPTLLAVTFQQPVLSKWDWEYLLDVNYHDIRMSRALTQRDRFVSGRIVKEKKAIGDHFCSPFDRGIHIQYLVCCHCCTNYPRKKVYWASFSPQTRDTSTCTCFWAFSDDVSQSTPFDNTRGNCAKGPLIERATNVYWCRTKDSRASSNLRCTHHSN
jgi:hypothetical protein